MPRNGSGVYGLPPGSLVTNGQTSDASQHNTPLTDLASDANDARPIVAGGTGAASALGARTNLGLSVAFASTRRCIRGGTVNAITLTTGSNLDAVATGQVLSFRAASSNTTSVTINVDGIGAAVTVTPTGAALPAGYIRTGIDTFVLYDGTSFVVYRAPEVGTGTNGSWHRFEDGTLIQRHTLGSSASAEATWTFEVPFASTTTMSVTGSTTGAGTGVRAWRYVAKSTTAIEFSVFNASDARVAVSTDMIAVGRWY
jgi:hypothetical protein